MKCLIAIPNQPGLLQGIGLREEGWKHLRPSDHEQLEEQHLSRDQGMEDRCDSFCPDAAPECHDETGAGIRFEINRFLVGLKVRVSKPWFPINHAWGRKLKSKDLAILSFVYKRFIMSIVYEQYETVKLHNFNDYIIPKLGSNDICYLQFFYMQQKPFQDLIRSKRNSPGYIVG